MSERFEIFKSSNSQYYFRLKAPNNEIILSSEGYTTKPSCVNGINSVKEHAPYDKYFERKIAQNNQYYFVLKASNGQVIGVSETYTTSFNRDKGIEAVKEYAPGASVVDLTV